MNLVKTYILKQLANNQLTKNDAKTLLTEILVNNNKDDIAIIGMSARFPKARDLDEFWKNLCKKKNCIDIPSVNRRKMWEETCKISFGLSSIDTNLLEVGGYLDDIAHFDPHFFNLSEEEAIFMDPLQRVLLETAFLSIEHANLCNQIYGSNTGVFIGRDHSCETSYSKMIGNINPYVLSGSYAAVLSGRISQSFNLKGPSVVYDTACSSALTALHYACISLCCGECDLAIVGGINIKENLGVSPDNPMQKILTDETEVKTFDKKAKGTVLGEGVGVLVLKSLKGALSDGDVIHAVIKGSAVNNDGHLNRIRTPNVKGHESVIVKAWEQSGVDPATISYIEAHGTGTLIGDPIEIKALNGAFSQYTDKKQFCAISTVKTNIGHTVAASGMASLMKAILSCKYKRIPGNVYFKEVNPYINFVNSPVYVNDRVEYWPGVNGIRRCGINSFGYSGTNAHVLLEEAPMPGVVPANDVHSDYYLFTLTAKSDNSLKQLVRRYFYFVQSTDYSIGDICYTSNVCRGHYGERLILIVKDKHDLIAKLDYLNGLSNDELFCLSDDLIYYGSFRIVREDKKEFPTDYSEVEIDSKSRELKERINGLGVFNDLSLLKIICDYYIIGVDIEWSSLYFSLSFSKVVLPSYIYDKQLCWYDLKYIKPVAVNKADSEDDLPEEKQSASSSSDAEEITSKREIVIKGKENGDYSEIELKLCRSLCNYLDISEISLYDDVFSIGADSITVMNLVNQINKEFEINVDISDIFNSPVINDICRIVSEKAGSQSDHTALDTDRIIKKVEKKEYYSLSAPQKRMYILNKFDDTGIAYNIPIIIIINGMIDVIKLNQSFHSLIVRHESLRTSFHLVNEKPMQKIHDSVNFEIDYQEYDESKINDKNFNNIVQDIAIQFIKPFDLERAPLFRVKLVKCHSNKHILIMDMHHIIFDGASIEILMKEFALIYNNQQLQNLSVRYKDFIEWQRKLFQSDYMKKKEEYWLNQFKGELPLLQLPTDYPRPSIQSFDGKVHHFLINKDITNQLYKLAANQNITLFMLLFSFYYILLYKLSNQNDIIVGIPIAGRNHKDLENIIGMFQNSLAVRCQIHDQMTLSDFFKQIKKITLLAYENQDYQFDHLVNKLSLNRDMSRNPVFDTMFTLDTLANRLNKINDLTVEFYISEHNVSKFDLSLDIREDNKELLCIFEYCTHLFKSTTIHSFSNYYLAIINQVLLNSDQKLGDLFILTKSDQDKLLYEFNQTKVSYPKNKTIVELFFEQVNINPEKVAVIYNNSEITYRQLNEKSNQLARLLRKRGIKANDIVGIMQNISINVIISIIAVIKAGAAYLPIDPDYPQDRILYLIKDSKLSLILTDDETMQDKSITSFINFNISDITPYITEKRKQIINFNEIPKPNRSLIDYKKYHNYIGEALVKNTITFQGTRGCPFNCAFCHKIWPKNHVARSAEHIYDEISKLYDMGIKRFVSIDDIFNFNKKNSRKFFELIIKNKLDIQLFFTNGLRGDILSYEDIDLMVKAGTVDFDFSLETASPRLQKLIKKNLKIQKLHDNINYIIKNYPHVIIELQTMFGLPSEKKEEAFMTLDFIKSLEYIDFPYINFLRICPGTDMEKIALENGISKKDILESASLAYHEFAPTLPFDKNFCTLYQTRFLDEYILLQNRLHSILPKQMKLLTEDEIIQKYNSYLSWDINNLNDLSEVMKIPIDKLNEMNITKNNHQYMVSDNFYDKLTTFYQENNIKPDKDAIKVLLIDLTQFFSTESNILYNVVNEPLGLMYIQTYLNEKFKGNLHGEIIKSRIDFDNYDELYKLIEEFNPDVIGIRAMDYYKDFFHKTVSIIRNWSIEIPIIVGGPYATSNYENLLYDFNIDIAVIGEGEKTFGQLIDKMIQNNKKIPEDSILKEIPGLAFIKKEEKLKNKNNYREILVVDQISKQLGKEAKDNLEIINSVNDLCYVIYTSGSTGNPKGVMISHNNLSNVIHAWKKSYQLDEINLNLLQMSSLSFDVFTGDVFRTLLSNGRLVLISKNDKLDFQSLYLQLIKNKISIFEATPSLILPFMDYIYENQLNIDYLKLLIFGSDICSVKGFKKIISRFKDKLRVINSYGVTETTIDSCFYEFDEGCEVVSNNVPIGKPLQNTRFYVLNTNLSLQPVGVPGELYIAGDSVGLGYLNKPELTKERFIPNPYEKGTIMYKTGDLVRWLNDGNIEFLGRLDYQVKIRGYRIELGEIEKRIEEYDAIQKALVIPIENNRQLCAYIISENPDFDMKSVKNYLKKCLPEFMIPAYYLQVDQFPLSPNGKIDRTLLPTPFNSMENKNNFEKPRNKYDQILHDIWKKELKIDEISINDNFFEIGGDSIIIINILSKLFKYNFGIGIQDFYENQTIKEFSDNLQLKLKDQSIEGLIKPKAIVSVMNPNFNLLDIEIDQNKNLKNILITGATGFLGVHILNELLNYDSNINIYCLIRKQEKLNSVLRLLQIYDFYFNTDLNQYLNKRLFVIEGDIIDNHLDMGLDEYQIIGKKIDLIIHSAALVRHYGNYEDFEAINVEGTQNIIQYCKQYNIELSYVSTVSVLENILNENIPDGFLTENNFVLNNEYLNNLYIKSKINAENKVINEIKNGLKAKILRVGNLTGRYTDGKFQKNINENMFYKTLKSLITIKSLPDDIMDFPLEFTPIDYCAKAIRSIIFTKSDNINIFHLFNHNNIIIQDLLRILKAVNINIKLFNKNNFYQYITEMSEKETVNNESLGIMINTFFLNSDKSDQDIDFCRIDSDFTQYYLKQLSFKWPEIDEKYIIKVLQYINICKEVKFI